MRYFTLVAPDVFRSRRFQSVNHRQRLVFLYLLAGPSQNAAGCYELHSRVACTDLDVGLPTFMQDMQMLSAAGLILLDEETKEIFIRGWFDACIALGRTHQVGVMRYISKIKSPIIAAAAKTELDAALQRRKQNEADAKGLSANDQHPFLERARSRLRS